MHLVITGSSTGIGRALAEHLLAAGHHVCGLARSPQDDLAARYPATFTFHQVDVSSWRALQPIAAHLATAHPSLDALILCAGVQGEIGPALAVDPLKWSDTVRLNLDGTFFPFRALHSLLLPRTTGRAKVIAFSGGGATKARPNFSAYGAAKTAIVRLIENLAAELAEAPIDLNSIAPGAINTRLTAEVLALGPAIAGAAEYAAAQKQTASGGASLAKVAGLVDWLLSPASDGISGRLIAAPWDPWSTLAAHRDTLAASDIYTLRRILPSERGQPWDD